jgi:hypothetical protein
MFGGPDRQTLKDRSRGLVSVLICYFHTIHNTRSIKCETGDGRSYISGVDLHYPNIYLSNSIIDRGVYHLYYSIFCLILEGCVDSLPN